MIMKKINELIKKITQNQLVRFMLVGVSNTIVSYIFYLIVFFLSQNYIAGNFVGFIASTLNAYLLNSKYVFAQREKKLDYKQLAKSFVSYGSTFLINTMLLYVLVNYLKIPAVIAPVVNAGLIFAFNFLLNKFWVYRKGASSKSE